MFQIDSTKKITFDDLKFGDFFAKKYVADFGLGEIIYQKVLIKRDKDIKDETLAVCISSGLSVDVDKDEILYPARLY